MEILGVTYPEAIHEAIDDETFDEALSKFCDDFGIDLEDLAFPLDVEESIITANLV